MKSFRDVHAEYQSYRKSLMFSPVTLRNSTFILRRFLRWLDERWEIRDPAALRIKHLHAWQRYLAEYMTLKGCPLNARTINKRVDNVKGFLSWLSRQGYVSASLADGVQYVKEPTVLPGSVLTHAQMKRLLGSISTETPEGYRLRAMLEVLYSSGIRIAELLGLNLQDVDFRNATALVTGKGRKERVVPIGKTALKYLEGYIKAVRLYQVNDKSETAVFIDEKGSRMVYFKFRNHLKNCAGKLGLDVQVTAHTFRRSCTTELLRGGAGMYHVKELLGHESLDTLKHYAKLTITDLKQTHRKCHPRERDGQ